MTLARWLSMFLLACVLGLAACGGDDEKEATEPAATAAAMSAEEYTAALAALGKEADASQKALEVAFKASDVETIKTVLSTFADAEDVLGDSVDQLTPPDDAVDANGRLADGLHELADEVRATVEGLTAETPEEAIKVVEQELGDAPGATKLDDALSDLKKLGYSEEG